jgi:hypothetical protein
MMRINLRQTTSMKRHLVYTTDDLRAPPFDATHYFASTPHENCYLTAPVEKVGLAEREAIREKFRACAETVLSAQACAGLNAAVLRLEHEPAIARLMALTTPAVA